MVGRKRTIPTRSSRRTAAGGSNEEPDIYQQMLADAGVSAQDPSSPERPLKRRRPGPQREEEPAEVLTRRGKEDESPVGDRESEDDDDDVEFQDVVLPEPTVQTMERDSDDDGDDEEDDDEELEFEDIDFTSPLKDTKTETQGPADLELNLTAQQSFTPTKRAGERRKPITKEERERRVDIHRTHLLCLLSHISRRNHWCNDVEAQGSLRRHLTDKAVNYLNPGSHLPQFGQAESLKNGLKLSAEVWKTKFEIRERGLRRALWAEDPKQLKDHEPPSDMDSCLDRADFREAAKKLQGSRDVGAQLYCALLRSVGVRARLVCSLQPLSCVSGTPCLPKPKQKLPTAKSTQKSRARDALSKYEAMAESADATSSGGSTARRRLGHPNATAYHFEPLPSAPEPRRTSDAPVRIRESPYPVYWVEVLDVGHQKWQPADPVVLHTFWKPKVFEPPITDKENCLSYVVAFEADGTGIDVTRRYAKAYTAKTRRLRVEGALDDGDGWWRKAMKPFRRKRPTDLDQIEDNELAGVEAREPMPRNVQDFKDHPIYALERHLRRYEVLVPGATPSGTVSAGSRRPLEKIYRRKDVRIARSMDKWYRLGREVKPNEIPAKWLPKKARPKTSRYEGEDADADGDAGIPIYTLGQTELYEPPPVRNGRVPKNKFGNIDVHVPSMVPRGGVHIDDEHAARAAFILGVDYAPALTGFQFKGRHGTAVLRGIVVAAEFGEAVRAVTTGLADVQQEMEDDQKRSAALRMWRRLLMGLRIRERIWSGVDDEERREADRQAEVDAEMENAASDGTEEFDMLVDGDEGGEGGGFLVE
ncbi:DNA repair protein rhp41 [Tolypocladium capitatum]|uniref:DNA repair protein rhp41 n=1 Tax=Tolypocladium capitatum TaxID=45235 RepID=A0A2K3QB01_9HYPO|nr:DNA repair protein rhp41 [Tolypocladium capitatum]